MGMKTKSKESLVTGLMWMRQNRKYPLKKLRHSCKHGLLIILQIYIYHQKILFRFKKFLDFLILNNLKYLWYVLCNLIMF